jgi:hypothetical protein
VAEPAELITNLEDVMNDTMSLEGTEGEKPKESKIRQTLTLAAAVAMLGVSIGVNVQELLACSPPGTMPPSDQSKFGGIQSKDRAVQDKLPAIQDKGVVNQQKLDAVQDKQQLNRPGMKPIDPRQMPTR